MELSHILIQNLKIFKRINVSILYPVISRRWYSRYITEMDEWALQKPVRDVTPKDYSKIREVFINYEDHLITGSDIQLTEDEEIANKIIMKAKKHEYETGIMDPSRFAPGKHIFEVVSKIHNSSLFRYLSKMPKGGVLHAHDTALCSTDFLIKLTYRDNLWVCTKNKGCEAIAMRFSKTKPKNVPFVEGCDWQPMKKLRDYRGAENLDKYLRERFSMYPLVKFKDNNIAWQNFMSIFILLDGLLLYAPVWADYYYQALKEFNDDGVQYLELRSLLPNLYQMDGKPMTQHDTVRIYKETLAKFKKKHPDFIGSKLIYAPLRIATDKIMAQYVKNVIKLHKAFPDFLVGFDLVGQEELGRPLKDFVPYLLKIPPEISFFFHAGETNWYGTSIDENLVDAVLLGTRRIGHGFAFNKHPMVMQMLKNLHIAIEVCPISNQVLQLKGDFRNHPCSQLFAENYPVVISSDDPGFWMASPLTHDFYMAFLGIASVGSDLRLLKRLSKNSLKYSALSDVEKARGLKKWKKSWDKYIKKLVKTEGKKYKKSSKKH